MASHWQKRGPKAYHVYKLQRECQRLAAEKGHTLGRFVRFSHGVFIAHCVECPAALGVNAGGATEIMYLDELTQAEHHNPTPATGRG